MPAARTDADRGRVDLYQVPCQGGRVIDPEHERESGGTDQDPAQREDPPQRTHDQPHPGSDD